MGYDSVELKKAVFAVLEDDAIKKLVFEKNDGNFLEVDVSGVSTPEGTYVPLAGDATVAGVKTFSSAPVVPDAAFPQAKVASLVSDLAGKAADNAVVKLTGDQTKSGVLTLASAPILPASAVPRASMGVLDLYNVMATNWSIWTTAVDRVRSGLGSARLHFYGDSLTWGSASTQPYDTNAFPERVRAALAATVPNTKVGVVFPVASSTSRYVLSGTWTQSAQFGIANAASILGQSGAGSAIFGPFTCDTFRVWYPTNTGLGDFDWAVDGVVGGTVSTNAAANVTYVDLPAGALGSHTLTLSNATGTLYIYGVEARSGAGLYVARGGVGGTTSGSWATNASFLNSIRAAFVSQPADLYVIELGVNDWYQQISPATFATNMTTIVNAAKAAGGSVLLVAAPTPNTAPITTETNPWSSYVAQIAAVAVATGVSWCAMDNLLGARKNSLLYTDGIHWTDALHSEVATALATALLGDRQVSFAVGSSVAAGTVVGAAGASRTRFKTGAYFTPPGGAGVSTLALVNGNMHAIPFDFGRSVALTAIGAWITSAGSSGSVIRFGIYSDSVGNGGYPGDLLAQCATTLDGTQTTTREVAWSQLVGPGLFWLVLVGQGASAGGPVISGTFATLPSVPSNTMLNATVSGLVATTGVTGVLPNTFPSGCNSETVGARIWIKT